MYSKESVKWATIWFIMFCIGAWLTLKQTRNPFKIIGATFTAIALAFAIFEMIRIKR